MDDKLYELIASDLKYIRDKVDSIESNMVTKEECLTNMEQCPLKTEVKKKSLTLKRLAR